MDAGRSIRLGDQGRGCVGAPDQDKQADHLADLMQHERLAVELHRYPFRAVNQARIRDRELLHHAMRTSIAELFADRVVVKVVGPCVLGKDATHTLECLTVHAPLALRLHVRCKVASCPVRAPKGMVQKMALSHVGVVPRRDWRAVLLARRLLLARI